MAQTRKANAAKAIDTKVDRRSMMAYHRNVMVLWDSLTESGQDAVCNEFRRMGVESGRSDEASIAHRVQILQMAKDGLFDPYKKVNQKPTRLALVGKERDEALDAVLSDPPAATVVADFIELNAEELHLRNVTVFGERGLESLMSLARREHASGRDLIFTGKVRILR